MSLDDELAARTHIANNLNIGKVGGANNDFNLLKLLFSLHDHD